MSAPMPSQGAPFATTGPQGHRGRMRARLLAHGPDGLADYEVLEMLLFLSIPRRDTKPLAKAVINRFGSMDRSLAAPAAELRRASLDDPTVGVFELVIESARRLAQADIRSRPLLNTAERLTSYLDPPARLGGPPQLAVLLLNNRNQLLAELRHREDEPPPEVGQAVAKRAIQLHATALILVTCRPGKLQPTDRDMELTGCILRAATVLSITVHDHWLYGASKTVSLKRMGLL